MAIVIITGRRKETIEKTGKEIRAIPFRWCLFSKAGIVLVHGLKDFNWMFVAFLKDKKSRGVIEQQRPVVSILCIRQLQKISYWNTSLLQLAFL